MTASPGPETGARGEAGERRRALRVEPHEHPRHETTR